MFRQLAKVATVGDLTLILLANTRAMVAVVLLVGVHKVTHHRMPIKKITKMGIMAEEKEADQGLGLV